MTRLDPTGEATCLVVVNEEEQYSIWPAGKEIPNGWRQVGPSGSEDDCVAYIDEVWRDIRPRSVRERLATANAPALASEADRPEEDATLVRLVADVLDVEPGGLTDATAAATEDRWTSLKHVELVATLEDVFGVTFSHAEIRAMTSVGVIRKTLRDKGSSA